MVVVVAASVVVPRPGDGVRKDGLAAEGIDRVGRGGGGIAVV